MSTTKSFVSLAPVGQVADVDALQVRPVHVEKTFVSENN
jgi:hypothetical protein